MFGIIKTVLGFRQFSLRGEKVRGEWSLVTVGLEHEADVRPQPGPTSPGAVRQEPKRPRLKLQGDGNNALRTRSSGR